MTRVSALPDDRERLNRELLIKLGSARNLPWFYVGADLENGRLVPRVRVKAWRVPNEDSPSVEVMLRRELGDPPHMTMPRMSIKDMRRSEQRAIARRAGAL